MTNMPMPEKTLPPPVIITWPMVATVSGTLATIGLGAIGLGVTAFLHLDGQITVQISDVRTDVRTNTAAIRATNERIDRLVDAVAANTVAITALGAK